jgi:very-long-chain (3R)-3-hydroxyacyl-CoA dehydratase
LVGIVKAPLTTTAMQVASRLFLVWGVNYFVPEIHAHWSFTTMVIAWSLADAVRYAYHMFRLSSGVPSFITWARYNFFFILYPLGVFSELTMVYQALPYAKTINPLYHYGLMLVSLVYIPGNGILDKKYFWNYLIYYDNCRIPCVIFSHVEAA